MVYVNFVKFFESVNGTDDKVWGNHAYFFIELM